MFPRLPRRTALVLGVPPLLLAAACGSGGSAGGGGDGAPPDALASRPPASAGAVVERVVDGDTVVADVGGQRTRVRLLGIDTPETVKEDSPVECYGPEASTRTKVLLPKGVRVTLETDRNAGVQDQFGRVLAYVTPEGARISVNESLLQDGYARLYVFDKGNPFTRVAAFRRAQDQARRADRGLWGSCTR